MPSGDWNTLRDALLERANTDAEGIAYVERDEQLTFGALAERASAHGAALQAAGVAPGDRVAITMSPGLRFAEVFWALQLIGAAPCAFSPFAPSDTLARRVARVRPRLVVSDEMAADMGSARALEETELTPDDLAFLQLTSGTSGAPRASMILHRNVMAFMRNSELSGQLRPDDVLVSWVPPWHDLGLVWFIIGPVHHRIACHIVQPAIRTIPEWLSTISDVRATWSAAPDFAYRLAVRMVDPATVELSSLRFLADGAEPVRWSSIEAFEQRFSVPGVVMAAYGLGEATLGVTTTLPGEDIPVDEHGTVSCGRAVPGLEVRAGVAPESPDEILVRGEAVFAGYFDAPEETARVLRDGWLHTGDVGYQDEEGRLFVLGRRSGMIKRAGGVVAPRELEEAAERVGGVRVAAATSVPDAESVAGATIVVMVEAEVSAQRSEEQIAVEVSNEIVAALGFAPGRVSVVPPRTIPRTENGKIRHARVRDTLLGAATG